MQSISTGVLIIGGGATGLWLLDRLRRDGRSALLIESSSLGSGQTIAAQGILHSGLKYSLQGVLTASAREAREMPALWRKCLSGQGQPDLSDTEVRSPEFYLWGTRSVSSKMGMWGARLGLQVTPRAVSPHRAPPVLQGCPGPIYSVEEQVISCPSLLANLAAANQGQMVQVSGPATRLERDTSGQVASAVITAGSGQTIRITADWIVLCAGKGNARLREQLGLGSARQQIRPLHMVMVRGNLPEFYGHCVDGATTRVSITSARTAAGEIVWQVGGRIAEDGVALDRDALLERAYKELQTTLPGVDLHGAWWSAYRIDRAEGTTLTGGRPESYRYEQDGNLITAWPTKLVLVPQLVETLVEKLRPRTSAGHNLGVVLPEWPRPSVAQPPWECEQAWTQLSARRAAA